MKVSILHWNRPKECLATIAALTSTGLPLKISVIDNHSKPENLDALVGGLPAAVDLIRLPKNIGWGPAHNVVLRHWLDHETSEFCIVSAHDALPLGDCITKLVDAMHSHREWGLACPEYGKPELPLYSVLRGARLLSVSARTPGYCEQVEFCHGTLAIFRRQCLAEIGVFNEHYFAYGDETEIGLRARRLGWQVGLVWGAVLINPGSWSGGPVIAYLWTRNSLRLAKEFGGFIGLGGRLMVVLVATLREKLGRAAVDSFSSPKARLRGVCDYFRGYTGEPPRDVLALLDPK